VVLGKRELRLHGRVAREAKRGLRLLQQIVMQPAGFILKFWHLEEISLGIGQVPAAQVLHLVHEVRGMTFAARKAVHGVRGLVKKALFLGSDVAAQAARGILNRRAVEGENRVFLQACGGLGVVALRRFHGVGVLLAWAVTSLAIHRRVIFFGFEVSVDGLAEFDHFRFVARAATVRADVAFRGRLRAELPGYRGSLRSLGLFLGQERMPGSNQHPGTYQSHGQRRRPSRMGWMSFW